MGFKIDIISTGGHILGSMPLTDEETFHLYLRTLGLREDDRRSRISADQSIHFNSVTGNGDHGLFRIQDVATASTSENSITVRLSKFIVSPLGEERVLDIYECTEGALKKTGSIDKLDPPDMETYLAKL